MSTKQSKTVIPAELYWREFKKAMNDQPYDSSILMGSGYELTPEKDTNKAHRHPKGSLVYKEDDLTFFSELNKTKSNLSTLYPNLTWYDLHSLTIELFKTEMVKKINDEPYDVNIVKNNIFALKRTEVEEILDEILD